MSLVLTLRLPTGHCEYRSSSEPPMVGEEMSSHGRVWIVASVNESSDESIVVTLTPARTLAGGARHGE
jgi:hypothetical protein